jgi:hypothetical protein
MEISRLHHFKGKLSSLPVDVVDLETKRPLAPAAPTGISPVMLEACAEELRIFNLVRVESESYAGSYILIIVALVALFLVAVVLTELMELLWSGIRSTLKARQHGRIRLPSKSIADEKAMSFHAS